MPVSPRMPSRFDLGPKSPLGYANSRIDRAAHLRADSAAIAKMTASADAGAYVVSGEMVVLDKDGPPYNPLFTMDAATAFGAVSEMLFLGLMDGRPRFGIGLDAGAVEALKSSGNHVVTDLRSIAVRGLIDPDHLPPLAEAKALLHWHARHRFCSNCGAPTNLLETGWRRDCPACNGQHFPRTDPVVIMLAVDGDDCLLGRSPRFAPNSWSCLAGFVEPGENIEDAVRREIREESSVACGRVNYLMTQPWPFPTSLMIGCHAEALTRDIVIDQELEDARWFSRDEAASMLMRKHPGGLITPPPVAIAHHIIRAWVEDGVSFG